MRNKFVFGKLTYYADKVWDISTALEQISNAKNFLLEYEQLCQKYNAGLFSCGCCDGVFLAGYYIDFNINQIEYDLEKKKVYLDEQTIEEFFNELKTTIIQYQ